MSELPTRRRWWWPGSLAGKFVAVTLYSFMLLIGVWFVALFAAERRLAKAVARCEELGLSKSWEELLGPEIPDSENAAVALDDAGKYAFKVWDAAARKLYQKNHLANDDESLSVGADALKNDSEYERLMHEADSRTQYRSILLDEKRTENMILASHGNYRVRDLARLEIRIAEGLPSEDGVDRLLRMLRLWRKASSHEPSLVAAVIGNLSRWEIHDALVRKIRSGRFSDAAHDQFEWELDEVERSSGWMLLAWDGERYVQHRALQDYSWIQRVGVLKPLRDLDEAHLVGTAAEFVAASRLDRVDALKRLEREHPLAGIPPYTPSTWVYNWHVAHQARSSRTLLDSLIARVRCLRIVNAMAKRRDFNVPLESLGLPAESLIDPFDGKPLRSKKTSDEVIVYSLGPDLEDDGGVSSFSALDGDVGISLPMPVKK